MSSKTIIIVPKPGSSLSDSERLQRFNYLQAAFPEIMFQIGKPSAKILEHLKSWLGGQESQPVYLILPEDSQHLSVEIVRRLLERLLSGEGPLVYEHGLCFPLLNLYWIKDRCLVCRENDVERLGWEAIFMAAMAVGTPSGFTVPRLDLDVLPSIRDRYFDTDPLPETIMIEPTSNCNFHCRMCPYHGEEGKGTPSYIKDEEGDVIELSFFKTIMDQIHGLGASSMLIVIQQRGEPLLHPDIVEMISYVHRRPGFRVSFSTNGYHLHGELAKRLIEAQLDEVYISLHAATAETAKRLGTGADFLTVEENIRVLLRLKSEMGSKLPRVGLKFVQQSENESELIPFLSKWIPLGAVVGVCNKNLYAMEDAQQWVYDDLYRFPGVSRALLHIPCFIPMSLPIYANGDARLCYGTFKSEFIIGNLKHERLKDVLFGERRRLLLRESNKGLQSRSPCDKCELRLGHIYIEGRLHGYRISGNPVMIHFYAE